MCVRVCVCVCVCVREREREVGREVLKKVGEQEDIQPIISVQGCEVS